MIILVTSFGQIVWSREGTQMFYKDLSFGQFKSFSLDFFLLNMMDLKLRIFRKKMS